MRAVSVVAHRGASGDFPENTAVAFQEAIDLTVEGLPEGITAAGLQIPKDKSEVDLTLKCDDQAMIQRVEIRVTGTAVVLAEPDTQADNVVTTAVTLVITAYRGIFPIAVA